MATTARSPLPDSQKVELFVQARIATPEGIKKVSRRSSNPPRRRGQGEAITPPHRKNVEQKQEEID